MACKIAIMAKDSGRFFAGDCVEAHKVSVYMGGSVEPVGGNLRVLDVTNAYRYVPLDMIITRSRLKLIFVPVSA